MKKDLLTREQYNFARETSLKQGLIPTLRYIMNVVPELDSRLAKEYYEKYIAVPQMNHKEKITEWGKVWYFNNTENTFRFAMYQYDDDPDIIYLSNVFVSSEYRGIGLGDGILNAADRIAENKGAKTIFLKVKKGSFAHNWYKRHSYADDQIDEEDNTMIWMKKEVLKYDT